MVPPGRVGSEAEEGERQEKSQGGRRKELEAGLSGVGGKQDRQAPKNR